MGTAGVQDWVFWLSGALLALGGLAIATWALFWDRSRGRKRCPKCWYSMEGVPESQREGKKLVVCPECGKGISDPRRLLRTRRRPWWGATAGLLLAAAYVSGKVPAWRAGGWTELVPTTALALLAPTDKGSQSTAGLAAWYRLRRPSPLPAPTISEQLAVAAWNRVFAGQMPRWQSQYFISRFLHDAHESVVTCVTVPDRWPIGEPIPVEVSPPSWLLWGEGRLSLAGGDDVARGGGGYVPLVPAVPKGPLGLTVEARVSSGVLYSRDVEVPIEIVPDPLVLVSPVDSQEASARVREALRLRIVYSLGRPMILAENRANEPRWNALNFRLGYRIEIVSDGRILATSTGMAGVAPLEWENWCALTIDWNPGGEAIVSSHPEAVRLVVTGDPMVLLRRYEDWAFHGPPPAIWTGRFETVVPIEPDVTEPKN